MWQQHHIKGRVLGDGGHQSDERKKGGFTEEEEGLKLHFKQVSF